MKPPAAARASELPTPLRPERRIRFTVTVTTTLEPLWYDEQWHRELVADGMTDEQALKEMVKLGCQEDPTSLLWETFGVAEEMAAGFAGSITEVHLV